MMYYIMSSISSYESYNISIDDDNEDSQFIQKMDELEEEHSGSENGVGYGGIDKTRNMKKELEIVSLYIKQKSHSHNMVYKKYKTYSNIFFLISLIFSGSLVIIPYFSVEKSTISSLGILTIISIFLKKFNFNETHIEHKVILQRCEKIQINVDNFLSKSIYISNNIEVQNAFYEKLREMEVRIQDLKEFVSDHTSSIDGINIFSAFHDISLKQQAFLNRYKSVKFEMGQLEKKKILDERERNRLAYLRKNKKELKDSLENPDYSAIFMKIMN